MTRLLPSRAVGLTTGGYLLLASLAVGCAPSAPASAPAAAAAVPVSVARVASVSIRAPFEAGGVVRARLTAAIASRVLAPVVAVTVQPGDTVRRGDTLVTLDARQLEAARAQAAATLSAADQAAQAAAADIRAAEAALTLARATEDRIQTLYATRSATAAERDQATAGLAAADAALSAARARAAAAGSSRDAARAAADAATTAASYAVLTAPFGGRVTERSIDPGSMATPGVPLLTLEDARGLRLEVRLDEARAVLVGVGQAVDVLIGDAASSTAPAAAWTPARVVEIGRIDPSAHSFLVKIDLPDSVQPDRSGQFGRARFPGPPRSMLLAPASAVITRGQLSFLFVVGADGLARLTPVTTGLAVPEGVEVLAGLAAGATVVTNPPATLVDGARVGVAR